MLFIQRQLETLALQEVFQTSSLSHLTKNVDLYAVCFPNMTVVLFVPRTVHTHKFRTFYGRHHGFNDVCHCNSS